MKTRTPLSAAGGFTLLECILALGLFSLAVVALVELINTTGQAAVESRRELQIQGRLETLLMEVTRDPLWMKGGNIVKPDDKTIQEGDVTYKTKITAQELKNTKGEELKDVYVVTVQARWKDGGLDQEETAETWVWPPLFATPPR